MDDGPTKNSMSGDAVNVVQARDISTVNIRTSADLPIPRQLPPDIAPFVDRETVLNALHSWLVSSRNNIGNALVGGIGGVGKSSTVTHWAHQVRDSFPDGELYIDLRGYHPMGPLSPEDALSELLCAFLPADQVPVGLTARASLYRSLLYQRRMLILLDNAATLDQIRPLLPGSSTCRVVITSRSRLSGLTAREGVHRVPVDVLPPERAVDLLRQVVGTERVNDQVDAAYQLARLCGHLPLALRIVAERLVASEHQQLADLVDELAGERERLDALSIDDDEFSSVRAIFSWSYRILPPRTARMFRLLSLPTGPDISLPAAAALANITDAEARKLLKYLVGAHLLQENESGRYRFHDLLRVYSTDCAHADESAGDRQAATRRLLTWSLHSAELVGRVLYPHHIRSPLESLEVSGTSITVADPQRARSWYDQEGANLVSAVQQAANNGEHDIAWQLPIALFGYFVVVKPWSDWISSFRIGLASARTLRARSAEAWLLSGIAVPHFDLGEFEVAADFLGQALAAWRETGQRWGEVWALRDLGETRHRQGRLTEAVAHLEHALAIATDLGDQIGEADTRVYLANTYCEVGRFDDALRCAQAALPLRSESGDRRDVAGVLLCLSHIYWHLGRFPEALDNGTQVLEIWRQIDYRHGMAIASENLGDILIRTGQQDEARRLWNTALEILNELGDPRAEAIRDRLQSWPNPLRPPGQ